MAALHYKDSVIFSIPKDTSAELKDLLLRMLKRNAKDRIEFGMSVLYI